MQDDVTGCGRNARPNDGKLAWMHRAARIGVLCAVFGAGYLFATITQTGAQAQVGDLGKKALEQAGGAGGSLGAVTDLGKSIVEMRDHVNALSQNLDKLDKIKAALGGG